MKKVFVKWYDAESLRGWKSKKVIKKVVKKGLDTAETVGFLYKKTDKIVAIVQSQHLDNRSELIMIPRSCVISIKRLK